MFSPAASASAFNASIAVRAAEFNPAAIALILALLLQG
jgi:hypothetical protein